MRKLVNMRLDTGLLARVDAVCGPRGRTAFVERALEAALSEANGPPSASRPARSPVPSSEGVKQAAPPQSVPGVRRASSLVRDSDAMARQRKMNEARAKKR